MSAEVEILCLNINIVISNTQIFLTSFDPKDFSETGQRRFKVVHWHLLVVFLHDVH